MLIGGVILDTTTSFPSLPCNTCTLNQLLRHLPIASQDKIMLGQCQAMHECDPHVHTSFGRGVGNVTAVIWRDLVEVRKIFAAIQLCMVPEDARDHFCQIRRVHISLPRTFLFVRVAVT